MTEQYAARVRDATVESVADLFMDLRLDGPSGEGWTYQQTARHYAKVIVEHFRGWRPAPSEPTCSVCGVPINEHPDTDACASKHRHDDREDGR